MIPRALRTWGGWFGIAGALGFVSVVVALHLVQPEYDARRQPLSALAMGPCGGVMLPAFACLALSLVGVQQGLRCQGASAAPRVLLVAAAAAMLAAGLLPLGTARVAHRAAAIGGSGLLVAAMYLLPARAGRLKSPGLRAESWLLGAGALASAVAVPCGVPLGVAQRLGVGCGLVWLCLLSKRLVRT